MSRYSLRGLALMIIAGAQRVAGPLAAAGHKYIVHVDKIPRFYEGIVGVNGGMNNGCAGIGGH
jgi:hypothetical protein